MATVLPRRHGPRVSLLDMVFGTASKAKKERKPRKAELPPDSLRRIKQEDLPPGVTLGKVKPAKPPRAKGGTTKRKLKCEPLKTTK